jgi:predicted transcriptional regulator
MPAGSYSPAALALMARGVTLTRVAATLDTTPTSVSRWLRGDHPAPPEMYGAVAVLGGRDLAREIRALVDQAAAVPA